MSRWYVKKFADLLGVSIQTLHHYDHIDLLKPSIRCENGYRLYSREDLEKAQQIIALKFFGFKLSEIREILELHTALPQRLQSQKILLEKKAQQLLNAAKVIEATTTKIDSAQELTWEEITKLAHLYHKAETLEKSWMVQVLTPDELAAYVAYQEDKKKRFSKEEREAFKEKWKEVLAGVSQHLSEDPAGERGYQLAGQAMEILNQLYTPEHIAARKAAWEKGHRSGLSPVPQETTKWLDQAVKAYYTTRCLRLLKHAPFQTAAQKQEWQTLMTEIGGRNLELIQNFLHSLQDGEQLSPMAREWLQNQYFTPHPKGEKNEKII